MTPALHGPDPVRLDAAQADRGGWRFAVFASCWLALIAAMAVNLRTLLHSENTNPFERSLLLLAGAAFLLGKPLPLPRLTAFAGIAAVLGLAAIGCDYPGFAWPRFAMATISSMALLLPLLAAPTVRERRLVLQSVVWLAPAIVALGAVYEAIGIDRMWMTDHTGARRLCGSSIPAFLGGAGFAGAVAAAILCCEGRRWRLWFVLVGVNLLLAMLTASRGPTLCAAAASGAILLLGMRDASSKALVAGAFAVGFALLMLVAGDQLLARIGSESTSGRDLLWAELGEWLKRYPLTGVGFGHQNQLLSAEVMQYTGTIAAHNEYLRLAVELGYAGAVGFWLCFAALAVAVVWSCPAATRWGLAAVFAGFALYSKFDNTLLQLFCTLPIIAGAIGAQRPVDATEPGDSA